MSVWEFPVQVEAVKTMLSGDTDSGFYEGSAIVAIAPMLEKMEGFEVPPPMDRRAEGGCKVSHPLVV